MPSVERARAPTNEMKMSKFGIATAIITEIKDQHKEMINLNWYTGNFVKVIDRTIKTLLSLRMKISDLL